MSLKAKIKQYGLINSLWRGVKYLLRCIGIHCESYWYMVNQIDFAVLNYKMQQYDYSDVKELSFSDFFKADPAVFTPAKLKLIKTRLKNGKYLAFGIVKNNMLAFSCWINTSELEYPVNFTKIRPLRENEGLLQDAYCDNAYRGLGYHSKMTLFRLNQLQKLKRNRIIVIVLKENIPSFKTLSKSGFQIKKTITVCKIWGKAYSFEKHYNERN